MTVIDIQTIMKFAVHSVDSEYGFHLYMH